MNAMNAQHWISRRGKWHRIMVLTNALGCGKGERDMSPSMSGPGEDSDLCKRCYPRGLLPAPRWSPHDAEMAAARDADRVARVRAEGEAS